MHGPALWRRSVPDGTAAGQSIARQMQRDNNGCMPDRWMLQRLMER